MLFRLICIVWFIGVLVWVRMLIILKGLLVCWVSLRLFMLWVSMMMFLR